MYDNGRENVGWCVSDFMPFWLWARSFPILETARALASRDRHGSVFLEVSVSRPGRLALLCAPHVFRQGLNTRFGERVLCVGKHRGKCLHHNFFVLATWNADIKTLPLCPQGDMQKRLRSRRRNTQTSQCPDSLYRSDSSRNYCSLC